MKLRLKPMKPGMRLAKFYKLDVQSAYSHRNGNSYWNLDRFPAAYFDADGCIVFQTEVEYLRCINLSIGSLNTAVRNKNAGMSIKEIAGYRVLNPPPVSV
jgi:hypothetical protein